MVRDTDSDGVTPWQTMSRVMQELRDEQLVAFLSSGRYLLLETPINVETEDLSNEPLDTAIRSGKLRPGTIQTSDPQVIRRQRRGQARLRYLTLLNYERRCAFCDVDDIQLLVASHISRWADDPDARGCLDNLLCLCRFHDVLFEFGYFSLHDDYTVVRRASSAKGVVATLLNLTTTFRRPAGYLPAPAYLTKHRLRTRLLD
jgi:hypothetical protein